MTRLSDALASGALGSAAARPAPILHHSMLRHRAALAVAVVLATAAALATADGPASALAVRAAGPELTGLLRFMAVIKAAMALGAAGLAWWRLGYPARAAVVVPCIAACALMAAGPVLIWSMERVALGAVLVHAGFFVLLGVAYFDRAGVREMASGVGTRRATGTATSLRRNGGSVQGGS